MGKKKPEPTIIAADGREIKRRYETLYWTDGRRKEPRSSKGFPKVEEGSIDGAGRAALRGLVSKVQCIDRVTGNVKWTVKRGERIAGTHIYEVRPYKGDPDDRPSRRKER